MSFARHLFLLTICVLVASFGTLAHDCEEKRYEIDYQRNLIYFDRGTRTTLEGLLVVPKASAPRPALLLVHQLLGISSFETIQARRFARQGYVVFVADIYGRGVRFNATQVQTALNLTNTYLTDRRLLRRRVLAGLQTLRSLDEVDRSRIVVAGFCFGGTAALEALRSGTRFAKGFISFHGGLSANTSVPYGNRGVLTFQKALVFIGGDDPLSPPAAVTNFKREFRLLGVDLQTITFSQTRHAFTDPNADHLAVILPNLQGVVAFNRRSTRRAFEYTNDFLFETFGCFDGRNTSRSFDENP